MSKILCIHPYDKTTRFLNRIHTHLSRELHSPFHLFRVQPWEQSHQQCLQRLGTNEEEFIIFLGHGRSNALYGAVSNDLRGYTMGNPLYRENYQNESFITEKNLHLFSGKKIFCLSCNSADKLGKIACDNGAISFIGFGDIPTDGDLKNEFGYEMKYFKGNFRGELVKIIKKSLSLSINKGFNMADLAQTIKMLTHTRIKEISRRKDGKKHNSLLAEHLLNFLEQMKLFGKGNEKILG